MSSGVRPVAIVSSPALSPPVPAAPGAQEKRLALEQVLQTSVFRRADQLRKFLSFICEMEIAGRADELCEYLIGVQALGRPVDYSPAEDAAVRRRASDLREKLQEVYSDELLGAKIRIELPKGTYVPRFVTEAALLRVSQGPLLTSIPMDRAAPRIPVLGLTIAFMLGVLLTGLAVIGIPSLRSLFVSSNAAAPHPGIIYEAESSRNTLGGLAKVKNCAPCSGGQKVGFIGNGAENFIAIEEPNVPQSGPYQVEVDYLLKGTRSFFISVNDGPGAELPLTGNSWLSPAQSFITLNLKAGKNRIVFYNDKDFAPDLDRIVVR